MPSYYWRVCLRKCEHAPGLCALIPSYYRHVRLAICPSFDVEHMLVLFHVPSYACSRVEFISTAEPGVLVILLLVYLIMWRFVAPDEAWSLYFSATENKKKEKPRRLVMVATRSGIATGELTFRVATYNAFVFVIRSCPAGTDPMGPHKLIAHSSDHHRSSHMMTAREGKSLMQLGHSAYKKKKTKCSLLVCNIPAVKLNKYCRLK